MEKSKNNYSFKKNKITDRFSIKNKKSKFECNQCDKVYEKKSSFICHIRNKHQNFICECCNQIFDSFYRLKKHCKIEHFGEDELFECKICHKKFTMKQNLSNHEKNVHTEKKIKCKFKGCKTMFNFLCYMNRHYKQVHLKIPHMIIRECDICGYKCHMKKLFVNHMIGKHFLEKFQCECCPRNFDSHCKFQTHFMRDHFMVREKIECDICHKKFFNQESLVVHKRNIHREKKFKCESKKCDKMFKLFADMKRHYKQVHLKIRKECKFECDICGYRSISLRLLKIHMKRQFVHQRSRKRIKPSRYFHCKNCDYKATLVENLNAHVRKMKTLRISNEWEYTENCRLCHENGIKNCFVRLKRLSKNYPMNKFIDMNFKE